MIKSRNVSHQILAANAATNGASTVTTALGANAFSKTGVIKKIVVALPLKPVYNAGTYTTVTVRKNGSTILTGTNAGRSTASTSATGDYIEFDVTGIVRSSGSGFATGTKLDSTKTSVAIGDWFDFTVVMDNTQTTAGNFTVAVYIDQKDVTP